MYFSTFYLFAFASCVAVNRAAQFKGVEYTIFEDTVTFDEAKAQCKSKGQTLAEVTAEDVGAFIGQLLETEIDEPWYQYAWVESNTGDCTDIDPTASMPSKSSCDWGASYVCQSVGRRKRVSLYQTL